MPYRVNNTFTPSSQFGAPIQALTRAMFGGATPAEEEAKYAAAEAHRAQGEHYRAQNAKLAAEADAASQAAARAQDPVANFVNNVFGADRGAEVTNFQRGVQIPTLGAGQTGGMDGGGGDGPAYAPKAAPRPGWLPPKDEAALNEQARVIAIANNLTGKTSGNGYDDIAKTIRLGAAQDAVMSGTDPTRVAQAFGATSGKMPFQQGQYGMGNELTGDLADKRLFDAAVALSGEKRNTELTEQTQRKAAAGASNASAGEHTARRDDITRSATLVPVIDPTTRTPMLDANNQPVMVRQADRGKALQGGEVKIAVGDNTAANKPEVAGKGGAPGKPRPMTKNDTTLLRQEADALLESLGAADADEQTKRAIIAQAEKEWQGGAAGHAVAVKSAIDKLAPEGFQRGGIYGFRKSTPVGGARASGPITPAAPAQAAPATIPKVRNEAEMQKAIDDGYKAIKQGADPAKVRERLKQMGVNLTDS